MKKKIFLIVIVSLILFSSCGKLNSKSSIEVDEQSSNIYEDINSELIHLKTFATSATVEYITNNKTITYKILQYGKNSGEYRLELLSPENVKGSTTIYDGKAIYQFNPNSNEKSISTETDVNERSQLLLTSFLKNYVNSELVSVSVGDFGKGQCTILSATLPGNHPYMATEKLWIDNVTKMPKSLVISDYDGNDRIIVTYDKFIYNPTLDKKVFSSDLK